jgi:hypothetical protein
MEEKQKIKAKSYTLSNGSRGGRPRSSSFASGNGQDAVPRVSRGTQSGSHQPQWGNLLPNHMAWHAYFLPIAQEVEPQVRIPTGSLPIGKGGRQLLGLPNDQVGTDYLYTE